MTNIRKDLDNKRIRRIQESEELKGYMIDTKTPVPPKKPEEFKFDKDSAKSFEYPVAIGNTILEKKSDGFCTHVTVDDRHHVRMYSSSSAEWEPKCFPEIIQEIKQCPPGYYHAELVGLNPSHKEGFSSLDEFVAVQQRPKNSVKNVTKELVDQYPLKLDIFDVLAMDNKTMLSMPLSERRAILERRIPRTEHVGLIDQWHADDCHEMQARFLEAIGNRYEGLIAKDPESLYVPGSRDNDWMKLKEFTTLDLAILGFYETDESRAAGKPFSAILCGTYNTDGRKFETLAKVKVGSKKDQEQIMAKVKGHVVPKESIDGRIYLNPNATKSKFPDRMVVYDDCIAVANIQTLDVTYTDNWHSCGLSYDGKRAHTLRIATYLGLRNDKVRLQDVTTTKQVHDYYCG